MPRAETPSPVEATAVDPLTREEVRALLEPRPGPCISIFLPTVQAGAETLQNAIRFKNLVRAAEEQLVAQGLRRPEVEELLAPLWALHEDYDFWQHQNLGLAVFRASDLVRGYRLPRPFDELVMVVSRFYVKPLFPLLDGGGRFYVLALSMNRIRLLEGSRWSVHEVDLEGKVPRSLVAAAGEKFGERPLAFRQSGPGARHEGGPAYHAHGASEDDTKQEILKFFLRVDSGLAELPLDRSAPLVLAGVDYLLPLYREATQHLNVVPEEILGNPDDQRPEELHAAARRLVEPLFLAGRRRAAERYGELSGTGLATSQLEVVVGAAHDGRVESLFTAQGVRLWGRWDAAERVAWLEAEQGPESEDLLDLAAAQTFLHGGEVFSVPPEEVPEPGQPLAAIFRW
jgi:hypothetical protein